MRQEPAGAERILWSRLRSRQLEAKFRRQYAIANYIVDFCCIEKRLVIELDGAQHAEERSAGYDQTRNDNVYESGSLQAV